MRAMSAGHRAQVAIHASRGPGRRVVRPLHMISVLQIVVTALEAVGEALGRRKPKTPEEMERQRIQRRNERAMMFFVVFSLVLCVVLLVIMALKRKRRVSMDCTERRLSSLAKRNAA